MVDGQPLRRLVRHHQDVPGPVGHTKTLHQMLRADTAWGERAASQGKRPAVGPQRPFQMRLGVDEVLPLAQFHRRIARNGAQGGIVAVAQHWILGIVIVKGILCQSQILQKLGALAPIDVVQQRILYRDVLPDIVQRGVGTHLLLIEGEI